MTEAWRIALTEPNREKLAIDGLLRIGIPSYLPVIPKPHPMPNGAKCAKQVPMFRGYLFVKFALDLPGWPRLFSTPGIRNGCGCGLMRSASKEAYQELSEGQIEAIMFTERRIQGERNVMAKHMNLEVGDEVSIRVGPWADLLAKIETIDDDERIGLLVNLLGKQHRVILPVAALVA